MTKQNCKYTKKKVYMDLASVRVSLEVLNTNKIGKLIM